MKLDPSWDKGWMRKGMVLESQGQLQEASAVGAIRAVCMLAFARPRHKCTTGAHGLLQQCSGVCWHALLHAAWSKRSTSHSTAEAQGPGALQTGRRQEAAAAAVGVDLPPTICTDCCPLMQASVSAHGSHQHPPTPTPPILSSMGSINLPTGHL